jgi:hypothetical protein
MEEEIVPTKRAQGAEEKKGRATERINLWLTPEQVGWLKRDKDGPSAAVRALIAEARAMENLEKSVRGRKRK